MKSILPRTYYNMVEPPGDEMMRRIRAEAALIHTFADAADTPLGEPAYAAYELSKNAGAAPKLRLV